MSLGHLTGSFMSGLLLSQFIFNVSLYNVWVEEWLSCSNDSSFYIKYKIEKNIKLSNGVKICFVSYLLNSNQFSWQHCNISINVMNEMLIDLIVMFI